MIALLRLIHLSFSMFILLSEALIILLCAAAVLIEIFCNHLV